MVPPVGNRHPSGEVANSGTIPDCLEHLSRQYRDRDVARHTERRADGQWCSLPWLEYLERIRRFAAALSRLGISSGDCVAIALPTSIEWECLDKSVMEIGAIVAGIEPYAPASHWNHILKISRPTILVVDAVDRLAPISRDLLGRLTHIIVRTAPERAEASSLPIHPWSILDDSGLEGYRRPKVAPTDPAVIIFTSGTTGDPKGILYTHEQVLAACRAILGQFDTLSTGDRTVSWLPMANLFQRMINLCAMQRGVTIYFHSDPRTLVDALPVIRPSILVGVPRLFLKLYQGVHEQLLRLPLGVGNSIWDSLTSSPDESSQTISVLRRPASWLARLVERRVKLMLGGSMKVMVTGSAPCPTEVLYFFGRIGIPLLEAYGVSENITPIAINRPDPKKLGSVGRPLGDNSVKIDDTGEILVKGFGLGSEYIDGETRPITVDSRGYYHTGDTGSFDVDGFLFLGGRIADTAKLSNGRRINLNEIESRLACVDGIDHIVAIGHGRSCIASLITLVDAPESSETARAEKKSQVIRAICASQHNCPNYLQLRGAVFLKRPLSIQAGELTPNLKVKRHVLEKVHARTVDRLFQLVEQAAPGGAEFAHLESE